MCCMYVVVHTSSSHTEYYYNIQYLYQTTTTILLLPSPDRVAGYIIIITPRNLGDCFRKEEMEEQRKMREL